MTAREWIKEQRLAWAKREGKVSHPAKLFVSKEMYQQLDDLSAIGKGVIGDDLVEGGENGPLVFKKIPVEAVQ